MKRTHFPRYLLNRYALPKQNKPSFSTQANRSRFHLPRFGMLSFRITAINPNRPKYPISAERLADGRGYKFSAENVAAYMKASDG